MFDELTKDFELNEECIERISKIVQSETDKVRTDYSQKLKAVSTELEQFKPKEKTEKEIEFEQAQRELEQLKFKLAAKEKGLDDNIVNYLRQDTNLDEFSTYFKGLQQSKQDYVAKNHVANAGLTKEQFTNMSIEERTKLYNENPALYAQLKK